MQDIRVEHVAYSYRSKYQTVKVLEDVSYHFLPGRFYAIIGRSGSGKSTLLSLLAGLDLPTRGEIYIENQSLRNIDRDEYRKKCVSVVYQQFHLFPLLTVMENVMFPMKIQKVPKKKTIQRAKELLNKVGLSEDFYKRYPRMLSGGGSSGWQSPGQLRQVGRLFWRMSRPAISIAKMRKL